MPQGHNRQVRQDYIELEVTRNSLTDERPEEQHTTIPEISSSRLEGWKFTLFLAFISSAVVLSLNIAFLSYSLTNLNPLISTIIYDGDCDTAHRLSAGFHLLINVLGSILLSASNFGMQCLAAPTRQIIDRAHRKGHWVDIGIPSLHNLSQVSRKHLIFWLCLALSSLPFHLVYNSAVYSTTSAYVYDIFAGSGSLGQKDISQVNLRYPYESSSNKSSSFSELLSAARRGSLQHLDSQTCRDKFAVTFQQAFQKLLVVTDDANGSNDTYAYIDTAYVFTPFTEPTETPYNWLCDYTSLDISDCNRRRRYLNYSSPTSLDGWVMFVGEYNSTVQYCLAEKADQHCRLRYSFPLTMVVIGFNLVKMCLLLYMWGRPLEAPILTSGDAIASFLRRPDLYSQYRCLSTSRDVTRGSGGMGSLASGTPSPGPKAFDNERQRWGAAVSGRRWKFCVSLWLSETIVCVVLLAYGVSQISSNQSGTNAWTLGLGAVTSNSLISGLHWPTSLVKNVLIANSPQLVFSFLYLAFNGLLTCLTMAAELSGYAEARKGLRVSSNPQHAQRSNYFLSVPYRYALPFIATSTVLHWLISQSLFLVGVEEWDSGSGSVVFFSCSWSAAGILSSIIVGGVFLAGIVGLSRRRLDSAMPIVGSCSLAIAAACHPEFGLSLPRENGTVLQSGECVAVSREMGEWDMSLLPVQWGAVPVTGPIGHCSFTSGQVEIPQAGGLYQ
ncbi:hypothetical protein ASPACDRAFT_52322 [Aspergillus aculeatus ATCC 16872]|uniref:DUF6536 domain-containing protein n=1 Tax=Aspergillus aculeatus (strain ATCC 16872 / CBS 172.66 / WB 5094) TaxID=690307 RepID=A0A1L9WTY5_ASPA1|nr:uncharacterized protein ASPACDRAFT_52322 [Aspergillus aculeatus ATCC 16872]OJJ99641.1 hypothetical protein ASPACDRAFT_52322 [Aspergillus aculeatus ATCC 16872]